jgi:hypothetical protein
MPSASAATSSSRVQLAFVPARTALTSAPVTDRAVERKSTTGTMGTFATGGDGAADGLGLASGLDGAPALPGATEPPIGLPPGPDCPGVPDATAMALGEDDGAGDGVPPMTASATTEMIAEAGEDDEDGGDASHGRPIVPR